MRLLPLGWAFGLALLPGCSFEIGSETGTERPEELATKRVVEIRSAAGENKPGVTQAQYVPSFQDTVLDVIMARDKKFLETQAEQSDRIRKDQEAEKEKKRLAEMVLKSFLPPELIPPSLESFQQAAHFPPVAQYYTGTCWSFATTSLLESEVMRLTQKRIKLAEMYQVKYEYLAKARRLLAHRGNSLFAEGSQANAVTRMIKRHGTLPLTAYPGVTNADGRHDHLRLYREMNALLESMTQQELWDEQAGASMLQVLLDRHMGHPPARFAYQGSDYDAQTFLGEVLKIDPDAYLGFVSNLKQPFYTLGELEVPDNWWHEASYHNLPLDEFYSAIKESIKSGYSLAIGIDVSEPGKDGRHDVMFVPDYDVAPGHIDQLARQLRLDNGATTDDHGVHLVGWTEHAGHDWFLVKDSGRSARRGKFKGYYFVRDDYVRLKVLSFMVHRDAVAELLKKFPKPPAPGEKS